MSKIVADTGSLITLGKIPEGFKFAGRIIDTIIVPPAFMHEVSEEFDTPFDYLRHFQVNKLIAVESLQLNINSELLVLDLGETEAIALADELKLDLLIEEKKGKRIVNHLGVKAYGVAGLIYRVFKQGVVSNNESNELLKAMLAVNRLNKVVYEATMKSLSKPLS